MPIGIPKYDPRQHDVHFYDPERPHLGAVCGRDAHSTVFVHEVTCSDCLQYICDHVVYFLDVAEATVAALKDIEDDCTPQIS
jgi:hypothetical protein